MVAEGVDQRSQDAPLNSQRRAGDIYLRRQRKRLRLSRGPNCDRRSPARETEQHRDPNERKSAGERGGVVQVPTLVWRRMGIVELEQEWQAHDVLEETEEWDSLREESAPLYREAVEAFLGGTSDTATFRSRIDSLSKSHGWWGFRGTGQMFFNQLVKAAESTDLRAALTQALATPTDAAEAEQKLETFLGAVDRARDRAESTGATKPGRGRINFFVSFFWELADREMWPTFFPNSRDVLEQNGLLDVSAAQPALYVAYRARIMELKSLLSTTTWGVEHLLWRLGKGAEPAGNDDNETQQNVVTPAGNGEDVYAGYRAQGLHFPDEVVTSLILSLATKRFVILSGVSGTGKTQIALGLARHLEASPDDVPAEVQPPVNDDTNVFVRLTAPKLMRARTTLDSATRSVIDARLGLPERGASKRFAALLPDGSVGDVRLNNLGFTDESRQLYLLFFLKDVNSWLAATARPGDFLHLELGEHDGADLQLDVVPGTAPVLIDTAERHKLVAVRSDWTDPRGLVGYFNPLTNAYARTGVVDLLLRAAEDPDHPYFVILDEMNLARVEYYFSDFLSAIESGDPIELMSPGVEDELLAGGHDDVPAQLHVPANVSFIGTVNVDETTQPFSPKVLDRANVIEFSDVDIERALGHPVEDAGAGLRLKDGLVKRSWLCSAKEQAIAPREVAHGVESFTEALEDVHDLLARYHLHFGYRVIDEVSAFVGHALKKVDGDPELVAKRAFDLQLQQKILPKLTGGRELEQPVARLLEYCLKTAKPTVIDPESVRNDARKALDAGEGIPATEFPAYPGSARKLLRMLDRLAETGFVGAME